MAYRKDSDLEFLQYSSNDDLDILLQYLIKDEDGDYRFTEEITTNELYKKYYPNHQKYWKVIASELQCFGGNTIMTIFRGGEGVLYKEIVNDVCDKLGVDYNSTDVIDVKEMKLLSKILSQSIEELSFKDREELFDQLGLENTTDLSLSSKVLYSAIILSRANFYKLATIIANSVSKALLHRGLGIATGFGLKKVLGFMSGPIGWVITGVSTLVDVAGPAYRVTIPSIIQVAYMRAKYKYNN